jgi:hypothetical protein
MIVKLYEYDGTYIKNIETDQINIKRSKEQEIRNTASFMAPIVYLPDLKKIGRRIKIFDGDSQLFSGFIDDVKPSISNSAWLSISCRDKSKIFKKAGFTEDTTYSDYFTSITNRTITSTDASSELQSGDEIQTQGKFYGRKLEANVLGISSEVNPRVEVGNPVNGDYYIYHTVDGLNYLKLTFYIDLQASIALDDITVTTNGTVFSTKISLDGDTFTSFTSGDTGRYIQVIITKSIGPIEVGVTCTSDTDYLASSVTTDDSSYWQPRPTDVNRMLTLNFASAQINTLDVKVGISDFDRQVAYKADIEALISGTWTSVATDQLITAGFNQIVFDTVTATGLRIIFKQKTSPVAVRYCQVRYIDTDLSLDTVVKNILTTEGETDFSLIQTTKQTPADFAITFEAGQQKLSSCIDVAESIGWEFFYNSDDKPVFRPVQWFDLLVDDILNIETMLHWSVNYSDADIYNVVLAKYESGTTSLFSTATNDSGKSPTSTINIGTRTSPVLRNSYTNTQAKLDIWAQEQLNKYSYRTITANCSISALDADGNVIDIEPGQIVSITDTNTDINDLFLVQSCELKEDGNSIDWALEVVQI